MWVIDTHGGLRFCRPKSREMPDAPLSPQFFRPLLIAARGDLPPSRYATVYHYMSNIYVWWLTAIAESFLINIWATMKSVWQLRGLFTANLCIA